MTLGNETLITYMPATTYYIWDTDILADPSGELTNYHLRAGFYNMFKVHYCGH
jgi:hypothetical protein